MSTLRLLTPHEMISGPTTVEAVALDDGRFVLAGIAGLDVLVPGDVVAADRTGVITEVVEPADVWAWEADFPMSWATTDRLATLAESYRRAGVYVETGTTISFTLVSSDERWGQTLAMDPDVERVELVRRPGQLDLEAVLNERYPSSPISMEALEEEEWRHLRD